MHRINTHRRTSEEGAGGRSGRNRMRKHLDHMEVRVLTLEVAGGSLGGSRRLGGRSGELAFVLKTG